MAKLWAGRFEHDSAFLLDKFNASINFDKRLYKEDIKGSIAHSKALQSANIINDDEQNKIQNGLLKIQKEIENKEFVFDIADEDIHMAIEKRLIALIGDVGKKLHSARSRNDQVALDLRLYALSKNISISKSLLCLISSLVNIAKNHISTIMPGFTHLQHAQPINLGFFLSTYAHMFKRDTERLLSSFDRNNFCPLGSAALGGTSYDIDRFFIAKELGFKAPTANALDSVSDRDFALELLFNISTTMMHISRLAEELILWCSSEFNFISLSDKYATGSSIMPQKKNPDVPELLRGKSGRCYGNLISLLSTLKALPLAYNKDMQEDKEALFDSVDTVEISLEILNEFINSIKINKENMKKACHIGHLSATDLADYLVSKCHMPFRDAHAITGKIIAYAQSASKDLSELLLDELKSIEPSLGDDIISHINLYSSMNAKRSHGGTSQESTQKCIQELDEWLKECFNAIDTINDTKNK